MQMVYRRQKTLLLLRQNLIGLWKSLFDTFAEGLDLMIYEVISSPFLSTATSIQLEVLRAGILQRGIQLIQ